VITIVTGIPRSGTSLMMQLFEAANTPICSDAIRQEDENNPKGYYELEAVKGIVKNNSFLTEAEGKVIKIVAPLVNFIDLSLTYRVVFMLRDLDEVVQSQEKMVGKDQQDQKEKFKTMYALHIEKSKQFLMAHHIPFIEVQHRELIASPEVILPKIMEFCGWTVSMETLLNVVDPSLYRNRVSK
jgi:hypothetical protein